MPIHKYRLAWMFALLFFIAGALIFVGRVQAETLGFSLGGSAAPDRPGELTVTVLDDATFTPIEGAKVSVGERLERRGTRSFLTDPFGRLMLRRRASEAPLAITVEHEGYSRISIAGGAASVCSQAGAICSSTAGLAKLASRVLMWHLLPCGTKACSGGRPT
jgi:hypothetical protein